MLQYAISSWHYTLVNYVHGKSFFFRVDIDHEKIRKERIMLDDKTRKEFPNDDKALEKAYHEFDIRVFQDDSFLKYTEKKKTSFCSYCRAIVTSLVVFPFVVLYKLFPKGKPKKFDLKERRRKMEIRSKIIRAVCGGINIVLGIKSILDNTVEVGIIQIIIGIGLIFLYQLVIIVRKIYNPVNFCYKKTKKLLINVGILKVKTKKIPEPQEPKTPNFIQAFFAENHNKYCPPVTFVDETDK